MSLRTAKHLRHFDELFAASADPWAVRTRSDEAHKRRTVERALGSGIKARGVELGCGSGITTAGLARYFLRLLAIDGSRAAITRAHGLIKDHPRVRSLPAALPCRLPNGRIDAVIASEVPYYLPRRQLVQSAG